MVFGSASSHFKHFARLLNVRCSLHFNKRSNEKADKGFLMLFFNVFEHLVHLVRSPLQVVHKRASASNLASISFWHQAQVSGVFAAFRSMPSVALAGFIHLRQNRSMPLLTTSCQAVSRSSKSNFKRGLQTSSPTHSGHPRQYYSMASGHLSLDGLSLLRRTSHAYFSSAVSRSRRW